MWWPHNCNTWDLKQRPGTTRIAWQALARNAYNVVGTCLQHFGTSSENCVPCEVHGKSAHGMHTMWWAHTCNTSTLKQRLRTMQGAGQALARNAYNVFGTYTRNFGTSSEDCVPCEVHGKPEQGIHTMRWAHTCKTSEPQAETAYHAKCMASLSEGCMQCGGPIHATLRNLKRRLHTAEVHGKP